MAWDHHQQHGKIILQQWYKHYRLQLHRTDITSSQKTLMISALLERHLRSQVDNIWVDSATCCWDQQLKKMETQGRFFRHLFERQLWNSHHRRSRLEMCNSPPTPGTSSMKFTVGHEQMLSNIRKNYRCLNKISATPLRELKRSLRQPMKDMTYEQTAALHQVPCW